MAYTGGKDLTAELASVAARLIVEEGMAYGQAKRKAARQMGRRYVAESEWPSNEELEAEVRAYIETFLGDTQPGELAALRAVARVWMERLQEFRPHLTGAAWHGTATRHSDIHLQLFCDDPKATEIALLNAGVQYDVGVGRSLRGEPIDVLTVSSNSPELGQRVLVHLAIHDHDDLRGALRPDSQGRPPRGDLRALDQRIVQP